MTPSQFKRWLASARRGESTVYFTGDISLARYREAELRVSDFRLGKAKRPCPANDIAIFVFGYSGQLTNANNIYEQPAKAAVRLVQRRVGCGVFDYIAVRTGHPLPRAREAY